ncbi:uncharacterized protein LOC112568328 isoform X2 [Pomacea canaliculata]|uniref:uncharacterized protein LOC112568328 isoform X2 n=1 Tax=Pomacea canaliculata TaxID=400727 RepID=UPI000D73B968|nr:uncharacterized protein LOC112568328 isoform X2 [Pomacea canaliculata]
MWLTAQSAELVFGNDTDDVIHAVTNRDITVTFDVVFDNCSSKAEEILIKVTADTADNSVTECHVIRSATVCDVTRMTSSCHCLSSSGPVAFTKTFSRHGNVTYRWTWCCWRSEKNCLLCRSDRSFKTNLMLTLMLQHRKLVSTVIFGVSFVCLFIVGVIVSVLCVRKVKLRRSQDQSSANVTWYRRVTSPRPSEAFPDDRRISISVNLDDLPLPSLPRLISPARISACSVSGKRTSTPDGFDSADDVFAEEVRYYPANCSPRVSDVTAAHTSLSRSHKNTRILFDYVVTNYLTPMSSSSNRHKTLQGMSTRASVSVGFYKIW